ncbi:hypothetical protein GOP47_0020660 [Adiantum capillus-veneris]|uniref:Heterokaryon incompatibility domain-containing protein n=1 Tax=Adiantum capillus-veneris TaxID=13818 RepID=A0A9D4UA45_ADICA|nr:hypothetical protein GOP47_0020660 [Adiantum capillus-veneris]
MGTGIAEARAIVAAIGKEFSSVQPFELLELAQGVDPPAEVDQLPSEEGRAAFLEKARLSPPRFLRVIDCEASVEEGVVVLIDWDIDVPEFPTRSSSEISEKHMFYAGEASGSVHDGGASDAATRGVHVCDNLKPSTEDIDAACGDDIEVEEDEDSDEEEDHGYCAISHTYGMYVYEVFDCACAAKCDAKVPRADPAKTPCKGMHKDPDLQQRVIGDILGMCQLLVQVAGVRYAWHDGVCIAQHDEEEVTHFIRHMGWIYANADSTIIFLHYIGRPMAPIGPGVPPFDLISRWQTRVWTFQEAALSKCRRYCVRSGASLRQCSSLQEFENTLASWYEEGGSNSIEILEEEQFWNLVEELLEVLSGLPQDGLRDDAPIAAFKVLKWINCLSMWLNLLASSCQSFPSIVHALDTSASRESKHEGDRINSILALAGVTDFDAHKDNNVEDSTREFFKRMDHAGLALALFTTNRYASLQSASNRKHTWFPTLSKSLMLTPKHTITREPNFHTQDIDFTVLDDGSLEVKGRLACIKARFNVVEGGGGGEANLNGAYSSGTPNENQGKIYHELVIDLVNEQPYGSFKAFAMISNDNRLDVGSALLPTLEWDSGGEMRTHSNDDNWVMDNWGMVNEWLHMVPRATPSIDRERLHALPIVDEVWQSEKEQILSTSEPRPYSTWEMMVLPRNPLVQYGERELCHFNAFIVFPAKVLELDFNTDSSHQNNIEASSISAILVQGDLQSKVRKIGCFIGKPQLVQYSHVLTFPNNLLVK